jgi:chromosome segregation ATPase
MADVAVPPEFADSPEIREMTTRVRDAQVAFVAAHKEAEVTSTASDPGRDPRALARRCSALELEKEQATQTLTSTRQKVRAKVPDEAARSELVALAASVRAERSGEDALKRRASDERESARAADAARQRAAARLRELRAVLAAGSNPEAVLAQIAEEVDKTRELTRTVLPARISERRERLSKVRDAIADPDLASDADLAPLASRVNALADETRELGEELQRLAKRRDEDAQLRQQAQVAKSVASKTEAARSRRDKAAQRRRQLERSYEAASGRAEGGGVGGGDARDDAETDMRSKFEFVKAKLAEYKSLKRVLDAANAEAAVLARTEALVDASAEALVSRERAAGVSGLADARVTLEEVSRRKAALDEEKGAALADISATIAEITRKIAAKKASLQPKVAELRAARADAAALEDQLAEKRRLVREEEEKHRGTYASTEREAKALTKAVREDERDYHLCGVEAALLDAKVRRATARGADAEATEARMRRAAEEAERDAAEAEARADALGENRGQDLDRVEGLKDAYRIVEVKLRVARRDAGAGGYLVSRGAADVFAMR